MSQKVKLKSVLFVWSESERIEEKKLVTSMKEANQILQHAAAVAPKPQGAGPGCAYDKTSILLTWEDGETYEARVDLQFKDLGQPNLLGNHVKEFCQFSGGLRKPAHMSQESYDGYMKASAGYAEKTVEAYRAEFAKFLETYELEEELSLPGGWSGDEEMYEALATGEIPRNRPVLTVVPQLPPAPPAPRSMAQYNDFKGAKYDPALKIGEIAKRLRLDLKTAVKSKKLPDATFKVNYRGGRGTDSLSVRIMTVGFEFMNSNWVLSGDPSGRSGTDYRYTKEAQDLLDEVRSMMNAYNYDRSDIMTDYFDQNFYESVRFDETLEESATAQIRQKGAA